MDSKNVALGAFVGLTLIFASIAAIEYSRGPSLSTTTSTETTTTTTTMVSTSSVVSVSTVTGTATSSGAFALSVRTDMFDYQANEPIIVSGSISPGPNANGGYSDVNLIVVGPEGIVANATSQVSTTNFSYSYTLVAGNYSAWPGGGYTVVAVCTAFGTTETATTQFIIAVPA
ncbi:MAG TPA: hypothetical protein VND40_06590 [Nitrososphaerales archaeon]|nr:hypothetical protein [Nitrososphaerales archaeon]